MGVQLSSQKQEIFITSQVEFQQLCNQYKFAKTYIGSGSYAKVMKAQNRHDTSIMVAVKMIDKS